jgi:hypothetical protein
LAENGARIEKEEFITLNLLNSSTAADDVAKRQVVASLLIIFQSKKLGWFLVL